MGKDDGNNPKTAEEWFKKYGKNRDKDVDNELQELQKEIDKEQKQSDTRSLQDRELDKKLAEIEKELNNEPKNTQEEEAVNDYLSKIYKESGIELPQKKEQPTQAQEPQEKQKSGFTKFVDKVKGFLSSCVNAIKSLFNKSPQSQERSQQNSTSTPPKTPPKEVAIEMTTLNRDGKSSSIEQKEHTQSQKKSQEPQEKQKSGFTKFVDKVKGFLSSCVNAIKSLFNKSPQNQEQLQQNSTSTPPKTPPKEVAIEMTTLNRDGKSSSVEQTKTTQTQEKNGLTEKEQKELKKQNDLKKLFGNDFEPSKNYSLKQAQPTQTQEKTGLTWRLYGEDSLTHIGDIKNTQVELKHDSSRQSSMTSTSKPAANVKSPSQEQTVTSKASNVEQQKPVDKHKMNSEEFKQLKDRFQKQNQQYNAVRGNLQEAIKNPLEEIKQRQNKFNAKKAELHNKNQKNKSGRSP
jgi:hypothetical protein